MTLREKINRYSPKLCRFLARKDKGQRPMTNDDIAKASGLSRSTVAKLSQMDTWDNVTVATMEEFSRACGINLLAPSRRRDKRLISEGRLSLIKNSSPSQRMMFQRILSGFGGNRQNNSEASTCSNQA